MFVVLFYLSQQSLIKFRAGRVAMVQTELACRFVRFFNNVTNQLGVDTFLARRLFELFEA